MVDFLCSAPLFLIHEDLLYFKLVRLVKLRTYFLKMNSFIIHAGTRFFKLRSESIVNLQKIANFFLILCLSTYILSCCWVIIGTRHSEGWVQSNSDNLPEQPTKAEIYITSVYWVMTAFTTVGYGDITGDTEAEFYFSCFVIFVGVGFFGYIIGNIQTIIVQEDSITELKEVYEKDINLWLIKLSKAKTAKAMNSDYFSHSVAFLMGLWDRDYKKLQSDELFNQLKPRLKKEISDYIFRQTYKIFRYFFKGLDNGFRRELISNMTLESFSKFEPYHERYKDDKRSFPARLRNIVMEAGQIPQKVYFIIQGEAYASNTTGRYIYFKLPKGSYFGASHLLAGVA